MTRSPHVLGAIPVPMARIPYDDFDPSSWRRRYDLVARRRRPSRSDDLYGLLMRRRWRRRHDAARGKRRKHRSKRDRHKRKSAWWSHLSLPFVRVGRGEVIRFGARSAIGLFDPAIYSNTRAAFGSLVQILDRGDDRRPVG